MVGIYEEYFNLDKEYKEKYGENTVLLMQVGAFYEVYGLITDSKTINDFSSICSLNIADKKATYKNKNLLMAGFKCPFLDKYIKLLIESTYTVVVYIQEDCENTVKKNHIFYGIYSTGTYYNNDIIINSIKGVGIIMSVWFHIYNKICGNSKKTYKEEYIIIGISIIDINTGKSVLYEYETLYLLNVSSTFDELEKYISIYLPREVIFIYNTPLYHKDIEEIICPFIRLYGGNVYNNGTLIRYINVKEDEYAKRCEKQVYINEILKLFYDKNVDKIIKEFEEKIIATQSFCYLLNFIQEHNARLVKKIEIPDILYNTNEKKDNVKGVYNVYLANNTLKQLNIIDDNENINNNIENNNLSSVLKFLDKTVTIMGSRRLKNILLNPRYDIEWLNNEYDKIKVCLNKYDDIILPIRKMIKGILDMDKLIRKIVLKKIDYVNINSLYNSIKIIKDVLKIWVLTNEKIEIYDNIIEKIINSIERYFEIVDNDVKIKIGIDEELDNYNNEYKKKVTILNELVNEFNKIYNKSMISKKNIDNVVKLHMTEKNGISLIITKIRGKNLKKILEDIDGFNIENTFISCKDIKMVHLNGNEDNIECLYINELCTEIYNLNKMISEKNILIFDNILSTFEEEILNELELLTDWIGNIDVLCTKTYIAYKYNYNKPIIDERNKDEKSFVEIKDLRHILIEHLIKDELYVPNDIYLGSESDNDGLLIFGTNMIGKTSLIRAVGLAIFIAQSGFYVPCSSMRYYPYRSIMTRIVCNDNLFKGISTFAMEMIELRIILKNSDKRTLVLGDELGASTEHKSAFSIFMATLIELSRVECTFLFTTHFYEILGMSELEELKRLKLCHLEVLYNGEKLEYNRKLKDGPGISNYGLECCKSMYFDDKFIELTYKIRNKYYPELSGVLNWKKSKYNSLKLKGLCEICGNKMGEEIHHKEAQKDSDIRGFLIKGDNKGIHKNKVGNLMSLCEKCHLKQHL